MSYGDITTNGDTSTLTLRCGRQVTCDTKELQLVLAHTWCFAQTGAGTGYVVTNIKGEDGKYSTAYMHRLIMKAGKGEFVDHRSRNRLENTSSNLRIVTPLEKSSNLGLSPRNTTGYKGVIRVGDKYAVDLTYNRKRYSLGRYANKMDAAFIYDLNALRLRGIDTPAGSLNFPHLYPDYVRVIKNDSTRRIGTDATTTTGVT